MYPISLSLGVCWVRESLIQIFRNNKTPEIFTETTDLASRAVSARSRSIYINSTLWDMFFFLSRRAVDRKVRSCVATFRASPFMFGKTGRLTRDVGESRARLIIGDVLFVVWLFPKIIGSQGFAPQTHRAASVFHFKCYIGWYIGRTENRRQRR